MFRWIYVVACASLLVAQTPPSGSTEPESPQSQPASRPAAPASGLPVPAQAEILKNLLGREARPTPIRPRESTELTTNEAAAAGLDPDGQPLLLEGTFIVERPGRLVREGGRAKFVFYQQEGGTGPRHIEILQSQLLEVMEREAESGLTEFVVSGEVMRYRDRNFLLLRKILRRVDHGNLGP